MSSDPAKEGKKRKIALVARERERLQLFSTATRDVRRKQLATIGSCGKQAQDEEGLQLLITVKTV